MRHPYVIISRDEFKLAEQSARPDPDSLDRSLTCPSWICSPVHYRDFRGQMGMLMWQYPWIRGVWSLWWIRRGCARRTRPMGRNSLRLHPLLASDRRQYPWDSQTYRSRGNREESRISLVLPEQVKIRSINKWLPSKVPTCANGIP